SERLCLLHLALASHRNGIAHALHHRLRFRANARRVARLERARERVELLADRQIGALLIAQRAAEAVRKAQDGLAEVVHAAHDVLALAAALVLHEADQAWPIPRQ